MDLRPDYVQDILVFCHNPGKSWLEGLRCTGAIRAWATFDVGCKGAIAMAPATYAMSTDVDTDPPSPLCVPVLDPDCHTLQDLPTGGRLSFKEALAVVTFTFLSVEPEARSEHTELLSSLTEDRDDLYVASSRVFGHSGTDFVLEVMGNDRLEVLDRVQRATDVRGVRRSDVHITSARNTYGFGQVPD